MIHILDTDCLTLLENPHSAPANRLLERLRDLPAESIATTIINYEEQTRGWFTVLSKARNLVDQVNAYGRLLRHLENYRALQVLENRRSNMHESAFQVWRFDI